MKRATAVLLLLALLLTVSLARAQGDARTVRGTVIDKDEAPVATAIVHLKNTRTLSVRTYISDASGNYRFSGLDPNVDYEIHAERANMTSNNRTVSSFDSRKEVVIPLKLDKEKKGS